MAILKMSYDFDLAVIGSGFGGSLMAMIARRLGRTVVLLERGQHPRFAIGESSTPLANLLLEELVERYDLPRLRPLTKWGPWQRHHSKIACGLKRGFTFYGHLFGQPFAHDADHRQELLVAASPNDRVADTHWYRPDFDAFLVKEAIALGVEYLDQAALRSVSFSGLLAEIEGTRLGQGLKLRTRFVIDATGPRGFLHRVLGLPELAFVSLPHTEALYTHFTGVRRWEDIYPPEGTPPYPPDDAAMHHVFPGGWIWVLRFNNGLISAGAAANRDLAKGAGFSEGAEAWRRLLEQLPAIQEQFVEAQPARPFVHTPNLSFRSGRVCAEQWALLPSAAGFVDPLLSTGFPLTLLGISRLARLLETDREQFVSGLAEYGRRTEAELQTAARLVSALYATMDDFEQFAPLTLLYFSAASFAETARRLGRPELAGESFLLLDHPHFGPGFKACLDSALSQSVRGKRGPLLDQIRRTIEPVDVAGLCDAARRNWYPARAEDLLDACSKLGASREEIVAMLQRVGFTNTPSQEGG